MKNINLIILFIVVILGSCTKNSYRNDGGVSNPNVKMTTYDYLKSKKGTFDSLVKAIDRAGLKDVVNGDVTFFATTNYSWSDYVAIKRARRDAVIGNENLPFTIDSIPVAVLRDSIKMYMFSGKINRDKITPSGTLYNSLMGVSPNVQYLIKFNRVYGTQYTNYIDYLQYFQVVGTRDDKEADQSLIPDSQKDQGATCQTSGIITTNGVVHVLYGYHTVFFNRESRGN